MSEPTENHSLLRPLLRAFLSAGSGWLAVGILLSAFAGISARQYVAVHDERINEALAQVPQPPKNPSAQALEQHLTELGLGLPASSNAEDRQLGKAFAAIQPQLEAYLDSQRHQVSGPLAALPAEVQTYLEQHRAPLAAAQQQLLDNPLPLWTTDFTQLADPHYPAPDFFPLARLQRLLLAQAIGEQAQPEAMARSLDAAWQITLGLRSRPDLLSQTFASILTQQQAGLMRHLDEVPPVWRDRLQPNPQADLLKALRFDSWIEYKMLRQQFGGSSQTLAQSFDRLYLQLSRTDWQRSRQHSYERLAASGGVCTGDLQAVEVSSSWWNAFGRSGAPQLGREWVRAGDRQLAVELTREVLRVKAVAQQQGNWPQALEPVRSQVCPEAAWQYQRTPEGIEISLDRLPTWRVGEAHEMLPLRYQAKGSSNTQQKSPRETLETPETLTN